mmetsp:Transcript_19304/g.49510  ORF Transcript_19304/g.49510 Transcript_19304/m.49510 type:complete len:404 (+) Transcript_19304:926-2137(+)
MIRGDITTERCNHLFVTQKVASHVSVTVVHKSTDLAQHLLVDRGNILDDATVVLVDVIVADSPGWDLSGDVKCLTNLRLVQPQSGSSRVHTRDVTLHAVVCPHTAEDTGEGIRGAHSLGVVEALPVQAVHVEAGIVDNAQSCLHVSVALRAGGRVEEVAFARDAAVLLKGSPLLDTDETMVKGKVHKRVVIKLVAGQAVTNSESLKVDLWLSSFVSLNDSLRESRDIDASVGLTSYEELVLAVLREFVKEGLKSHVVVHRSDVIVGVVLGGVVGIGIPDSSGGLQVEHVGKLVPGEGVHLESTSAFSNHGSVLRQETVKRRAARSTVEPKSDGVLLWASLRLDEPVVKVLLARHLEVPRVHLQAQGSIEVGEVGDKVLRRSCGSDGQHGSQQKHTSYSHFSIS